MMSDTAGSKAAFYDSLDALERDSDDEEPNPCKAFLRESRRSRPQAAESHANRSSAAVSSPPRSSNPATTRSNDTHAAAMTPVPAQLPRVKKLQLQRFNSAPTPVSKDKILVEGTPDMTRMSDLRKATTTTPSAAETSVVKETPLAQAVLKKGRGAPRRTASDPSSIIETPKVVKETPVSKLGKRKRKEEVLKMVPEARRIFKDQTIYCIPPDKIALPRRIRITRAQEHGANWTQALSNEVTHIIADTGIQYHDVIKYIGLPNIPSGISLVNENYTIECIQERALLNPDQYRFKVKGQEEVEKRRKEERDQMLAIVSSFESAEDDTLHVKPAQSRSGRWEYEPPERSPQRSEEETPQGAQPVASEQSSVISSPEGLVGSNSPTPAQGVTAETGMNSNERLPKSLKNNAREPDDLDKAIQDALAGKDMPPDSEDEDDEQEGGHPSSRDYDNEDSQDEITEDERDAEKPLRAPRKGAFNHKNFSCMKGGTGKVDGSNPNAQTIKVLQEMSDHHATLQTPWRAHAYRKAITTLKRQERKICTAKEAIKLPGINEKIAKKVEEIAKSGRLRQLEMIKDDPRNQALALFMGVYGVGLTQANLWINQSFSTLEDLEKKAKLTDNQRIGIKYYDDLQTRMPRNEVAALGKIVTDTSRDIDPQVEIIIGGSYRRGSANSGDIDCIVTKPGTTSTDELTYFLHKLTETLHDTGFLTVALAKPSETGSKSKWHGCCVLPKDHPLSIKPRNLWRRIDFLVVPESQIGAALLYFTGNDIFNRSIRLLASYKGMRLNQRGLYKNVMRGPGRVKMTEGELIEGTGRYEEKIFEALGVPYRPPHERIC